jgi:hypothetical protein
MTCQECELLLAEDERTAAVETHLGECAECRALALELAANAEALKALRDHEMPALTLRAGRSVRHWVRAPAAAAAVVLLALGVSRLDRKAPGPAPEPAVETRPPTVAPVVAPPAEPPALARTRPSAARKQVAAPKPPPQEEPLLVKMLTPDPDVVIYWLIEPKETL